MRRTVDSRMIVWSFRSLTSRLEAAKEPLHSLYGVPDQPEVLGVRGSYR